MTPEPSRASSPSAGVAASNPAKVAVHAIVPSLGFVDRAEEAVNFYVSLFDGARVVRVLRSEGTAYVPKGKALQVEFELGGQRYTAFDGGPHFAPSPAFSLSVMCRDQDELDRVWAGLVEGGEAQPCGWLVDRFGISWQVVPKALIDMLHAPQGGDAEALMQAMLAVHGKFDVQALVDAYEGR